MAMTRDEICERKKEQNYSYEKLADLTGFSAEVIRQVLEDKNHAADHAVLSELEEIFAGTPANVIREAQAPYLAQKKQGEFTIEDYYALPDTRRVELIDGVIYDMSAPSSIHQAILIKISNLLFDHIQKNQGKCMVFAAPLDVQLDCDNKTMVQPDLVVICDRNKLCKENVFGAPDFVMEILSRSTRKKDTIKKLEKYEAAGVREYWIIDPDKKKVIVYEFEKEMSPTIYGFEDKIPVGIFGEACIVDFTQIYEYVRFLYEE